MITENSINRELKIDSSTLTFSITLLKGDRHIFDIKHCFRFKYFGSYQITELYL